MNLQNFEQVQRLVTVLEWIRKDSNFNVSVRIDGARHYPRREQFLIDMNKFSDEVFAPVLNAKRKEMERAILSELKALGVEVEPQP